MTSMRLKAAFLAVLVAAAIATIQANPGCVKATAKPVPMADGFLIQLTATNADPDANLSYTWRVRIGCHWVRFSTDPSATYRVGGACKAYSFRLLVSDGSSSPRRTGMRVDMTAEACYGRALKRVPIAVASATPENDVVTLNGAESKNCNNHVWELQEDGNYTIIGNTPKVIYKAERDGEHVFRLTCLTSSGKKGAKSTDTTEAHLDDCQEDLCKDVVPKAVAGSEVINMGGHYEVLLNAEQSEGCDSYQWKLVESGGYITTDVGMYAIFKVQATGVYTFYLTCKVTGCKNLISQAALNVSVENCHEKQVSSRARATIDKSQDHCTVKLDASASEGCTDYIWSFNKGNSFQKISDKQHDQYVVYSYGQQTFHLECVDSTCTRTEEDTATVLCEDPCNQAMATARADSEVLKAGEQWRVELDGSASTGCISHRWERLTAAGVEVVGRKAVVSYYTSVPGHFSFRLSCLDRSCGKEDSVDVVVDIDDPCYGKSVKAVMSTEQQEQCVFNLNGRGSTGCVKYVWEVKEKGTYKVISTGSKPRTKYQAPDFGTHSIRMKCLNDACDLSDATTTNVICEDPCKGLMLNVVGEGEPVTMDGYYSIELDGSNSYGCSQYIWEVKTEEGYDKISSREETTYRVDIPGIYTFRITGTNETCGMEDSDEIVVDVTDPCYGKTVEAVFSTTEQEQCKFSLNGRASRGCSTYVWEVKQNRKYEPISIGTRPRAVYQAPDFGKFTIRMKCLDDTCDLSDDAISDVVCEDPCTGAMLNVEAMGESRTMDGYYNIDLDGSNSYGCSQYIWEIKTEEGYTKISSKEKTTYRVDIPGAYTFRITGTNETCGMEDSDEVLIDVTDSCYGKFVKAVAEVQESSGGSVCAFDLSASKSKLCHRVKWEVLQGNTYEVIGTRRFLSWNAPRFGNYRFKLTCTYGRCDMEESTVVSVSCENPCGNEDVMAKAAASYTNQDEGYRIQLDGSDSRGCNAYLWEVRTEAGFKKVARSKRPSYLAPTPGRYEFSLSCIHKECDITKKDKVIVDISDPCWDKTVSANPRVTKHDHQCQFDLESYESKGCKSYLWEFKSDSRFKVVSEKRQASYSPDVYGNFVFRFTCTDETCEMSDVRKVKVECEDPCTGRIVTAVANGDFVKEGKDYQINLDASSSKGGNKYVWSVKTGSGYDNISKSKTTSYVVSKPGKHVFLLTVTDSNCGITREDEVEINIIDKCYNTIVKSVSSYKTKTLKEGCQFTLDGSASLKCTTYKWAVKDGNSYSTISTSESTRYNAGFGESLFRLTCIHSSCEKIDRSTVLARCEDPCKDRTVQAVADIPAVSKQDESGNYRVILDGSKSIGCTSFTWYRVKKHGLAKIGIGKSIEWKTKMAGSYSFQLTCRNQKCGLEDSHEYRSKCIKVLSWASP